MTSKIGIMKTNTFLVFLTLVLMMHCTSKETRKQPPLAQVKPVEDVYFGIKISDPYSTWKIYRILQFSDGLRHRQIIHEVS
jgi:hypothetical protein